MTKTIFTVLVAGYVLLGTAGVRAEASETVSVNDAHGSKQQINPEAWRFVYHNQRWWYWHPGQFWSVHDGKAWRRYVAPTNRVRAVADDATLTSSTIEDVRPTQGFQGGNSSPILRYPGNGRRYGAVSGFGNGFVTGSGDRIDDTSDPEAGVRY